MSNAPIYRIVLTGGPCGGKTTALARIREHFTSYGFRVFMVPESATTLLTNGLSFAGITTNELYTAQTNMMKMQMSVEDTFIKIAESTDKPCIVLCDRGCLDPKAFIDTIMWQAMLDENSWSEQRFYGRYEAVIHMVTAAIGAEEFYTLENNAARTETPGQSAAIDVRLQASWVGHPHLRVIDNSSDFETKIKRVIMAISQVVGVPEPVEIERKFIVKGASPNDIPAPCNVAEIEQTYLKQPGGEEARVRRRGKGSSFFYTYTIKRDCGEGKRTEIERAISGREYVSLLNYADPDRKPIKKKRYCFLWRNQYFELDEYEKDLPGLPYRYILEIELTDMDQKIEMPPFIDIAWEATGDKQYNNHTLAKRR